MVATWTAGYVIGEIPSNIILTRVRPAIWIPTIEVGQMFSNLGHEVGDTDAGIGCVDDPNNVHVPV